MDLLDYIKDLLFKNDYVILPGLGGFSGHYKSAEINEGTFTPPCESVSFDKNLKYNDNLLTDCIINNEGISRTEASNKVSRSVKNIIYRLGEGEKIEIPDIGILQYDLNGDLYFTEQVKKNFNISSFGMPSFKFDSYTEKERTAQEKKIIITKKKIPMSKPIQGGKINLKKEISSTKRPVHEKGTYSKMMMLLKVLLVLAVIIVTALIINKELNKKHDKNLPVKEKIIISAQSQDSIAKIEQDSIVKTEDIENQIIVNEDTISNISKKSTSPKSLKIPEKVSSSNDSCFIIGGVFKSHGHAVKYMVKMKDKGYTRLQDRNFVGDLHYVTIDQFSTFKDAESARKKILTEDPKSGVWIYKKH